MDLTLRCFGKWWVRSSGNRASRDRAGEPSSSVVLDKPVRLGNRFPQLALVAQMPSYGAGIGQGVLHSVLRWTRGGEVSVVKFE